jgi:hypothetical protein
MFRREPRGITSGDQGFGAIEGIGPILKLCSSGQLNPPIASVQEQYELTYVPGCG